MNSQLNSRASENKVTRLDRCASSWIEIVLFVAFLIDRIAVSVFVDILTCIRREGLILSDEELVYIISQSALRCISTCLVSGCHRR